MCLCGCGEVGVCLTVTHPGVDELSEASIWTNPFPVLLKRDYISTKEGRAPVCYTRCGTHDCVPHLLCCLVTININSDL